MVWYIGDYHYILSNLGLIDTLSCIVAAALLYNKKEEDLWDNGRLVSIFVISAQKHNANAGENIHNQQKIKNF